MSGYIEAGYIAVLGVLGCYTASLVARERSAQRRLGGGGREGRGVNAHAVTAAPIEHHPGEDGPTGVGS